MVGALARTILRETRQAEYSPACVPKHGLAGNREVFMREMIRGLVIASVALALLVGCLVLIAEVGFWRLASGRRDSRTLWPWQRLPSRARHRRRWRLWTRDKLMRPE